MAQLAAIRAKGNLTVFLTPLVSHSVDDLGSNSWLIAQDDHHCRSTRVERCDACPIRRRAPVAIDGIVHYFGPSKIDSFADLAGGPAEYDNHFVESFGPLSLLRDPP